MTKKIIIIVIALIIVVSTAFWSLQQYQRAIQPTWSDAEIAMLRSLWIGNLPPLPPDPSNAVADDPRAVELGHRIFFDKRFSANGEVACATCHQPENYFTDGLPLGQAIGTTARHTPSIVGTAYSPWFYWDGRRDNQWSQALTPLEAAPEHGGTRTQYIRLIYEDPTYRAAYEDLFGPLPDFSDQERFPDIAGPTEDAVALAAWEGMTTEDREAVNRVFANIGKAIAAYERQIMPGPSRFDAYVEALLAGDDEKMQTILNDDEVAGLRLFLQSNCTQCHNGPLFTNNGFHNIGIPSTANQPLDFGRITAVQQVIDHEFNCLGPYSDADPSDCTELRFVKTLGEELPGAFKVPSLRNVAETAPYMHTGQFATLREVLDHYNQAKVGPLGHSDLVALNLSDEELAQLAAFLHTLSGPLATRPELLEP